MRRICYFIHYVRCTCAEDGSKTCRQKILIVKFTEDIMIGKTTSDLLKNIMTVLWKKIIDYAAKCSISLIYQSGNSLSVNKQVLAEILRKEAIDAQTPDDHMRK